MNVIDAGVPREPGSPRGSAELRARSARGIGHHLVVIESRRSARSNPSARYATTSCSASSSPSSRTLRPEFRPGSAPPRTRRRLAGRCTFRREFAAGTPPAVSTCTPAFFARATTLPDREPAASNSPRPDLGKRGMRGLASMSLYSIISTPIADPGTRNCTCAIAPPGVSPSF